MVEVDGLEIWLDGQGRVQFPSARLGSFDPYFFSKMTNLP